MPTQGNGISDLVVGMVVERKAIAFGIHQIIVTAYVFFGLHDGKARPAVDAFHKLTVHLEINTCGVGA